MNKKILIPGGKTSDWDLVNAAHRMGMYVITSGTDRDAPAHRFSDEYVCADYSDKEAMLDLAREKAVDYMCSSANDIALVSTAYVCEKLGLPGHDSYETTLKIHHKDKFKDLAKQLKLHVPEGEWFDNREAALAYAKSLSYKIIVKPVDLVGGNGISTAETDNEKEEAIDKAFQLSLCGRIVIERFIEGTAHSISAFIIDRKVAAYFSDNQYALAGKYYMSTSSCPAAGIEKVAPLLLEDLNKLAQALGLVDGRLTPQYIMDAQGNPYILEITRRCSGDLYTYQVSKALGINAADWLVKAECGFDCHNFPKGLKQKGFCGRHCLVAPRNGTITDLRIDPELEEHVYDRLLWWEPEFVVSNWEKQSLGILFYQFDSEAQMRRIVENLPALIHFTYKE